MKDSLKISIFLFSLIFSGCSNDDPVPDPTGPQVETLAITGSFKGDDGLSVDSKGAIYVSHLSSGAGTTIYRVGTDGVAAGFVGDLAGPMGHGFDSNDNLFLALNARTSIMKITPEGEATDYLLDARFKGGSLVVDDDGTIFHTVFSSNTVYRISPDKEVSVVTSGEPLNVPFGITMDGSKNLFVANFRDGVVTRISPSGQVDVLAEPGTRIGFLTYTGGYLYGTGWSSDKIYRIGLDGVVTVLAGSGEQGDEDGRGEQASFNTPNGIAPSPDGKALYVSQGNFKIRKIILED